MGVPGLESPIDWSNEMEVNLFQSMYKLKPVGMCLLHALLALFLSDNKLFY